MRQVLVRKESSLFRCCNLGECEVPSQRPYPLPAQAPSSYMDSKRMAFFSLYSFVLLTSLLAQCKNLHCLILANRGDTLTVRVSGEGQGAAGPAVRKPEDTAALSPPLDAGYSTHTLEELVEIFGAPLDPSTPVHSAQSPQGPPF